MAGSRNLDEVLTLAFTSQPGLGSTRSDDQILVGNWPETNWTLNTDQVPTEVSFNWNDSTYWNIPSSSQDVVFDQFGRKFTLNILAVSALNRTGNTVVTSPTNIVAGTHAFSGTTRFQNLTVTAGQTTLTGTTTIDSLVVSGEVILGGGTTRINTVRIPTGGKLTVTGGSNTIGEIILEGGVLTADASLSVTRLSMTAGSAHLKNSTSTIANLTVAGGTLQLNAALQAPSNLNVANTGRVELNVVQPLASVNLTGGTIVIGWDAAENALGTAIIDVNGNATILSAAIPANVPLSTKKNYVLANTINLNVGVLTLGNDVSTAVDSAARERQSYLRVPGLISGGGALRKVGSGSVYLTGSNTYTGQTTLDAGELIAGSASALGATSGTTRINGGFLGVLPDTVPFTVSESLSIGSTGSVNLRRLAGVNGPITLDANAAFQVEPGTAILSNLAFNGPATIQVIEPFNPAAGNVFDFATALTGNGDLTWSIPATYTAIARGASSRTGATRVQAGGTLQLGNAAVIADRSAVEVRDASTLDINGTVLGLSSLTGTGNVNLGADTTNPGRLTLSSNAPFTFPGRIVGNGQFIKSGTANLTLSGTSNFSGGLRIDQGQLTVGAANALSDNSAIAIATGATLSFAFSDTVPSIQNQGTVNVTSPAVALSLTGNLINEAAGTLNFGARGSNVVGTLDNAGNINLNGTELTVGQLVMRSGIVSDTFLAGSIIAQADYVVQSGTVSANLRGDVQLVKGGVDTATLSGRNRYTGETKIDLGTLSLAITGALPASQVTVGDNAILLLNNNNQTIGALVGQGQVQLGSARLTIDLLDNLAFDGTISGTGIVRKTGNGTWTVRTAQRFSGGIEVLGGTLQADGPNSLGTGSVQVQPPGVLNIVGPQRITSLLNAGTVSLTAPTLQFSGDFTNTGVLNAGTGTLETIGAAGNQTIDLGNRTIGSLLISGAANVRLNSLATNLTINAVTMRGGNLDIGAMNLTVQTFIADSATATLLGTGSIASAAAFLLNAGTIAVPLTGAAGLIKSSPGNVTLSTANGYRGTTRVEQGTLNVTTSGGLGGGAVAIEVPGTLVLAGTQAMASLTNNGSLQAATATVQLSGNLDNLGTMAIGTLETVSNNANVLRINLGANAAVGNLITSGAAPVQLAAANQSLTLSGSVQVGLGALDLSNLSITTGQLVLRGADTTEIRGTGSLTSTAVLDLRSGIVGVALRGTAGLRKSTTGVVTLTTPNVVTGTVEVQAGRLVAQAANAIGGIVTTLPPAVLELGSSQAVASVTNAGTLVGNESVLTIAGDFINTGTFEPGTSTLVANAAATQTFNLGASRAHSITASGGGAVLLQSVGGRLELSGDMRLDRGSIQLGANALSVRSLRLDGNARLEGTAGVVSTSDYDLRSGTVAMSLQGAVGLRKSTAGEVTLAVSNSYTGTTTLIDNGILNASVASALGTGDVQIGAAARINVAATQTVRSVTNSGTLDAGTATLRVTGDFASPGVFVSASSTLDMIGAIDQSLVLGPNGLSSLRIGGAVRTVTMTSSQPAVTLTGNLLLNSGSLDVGSLPLVTQSFVLNGANDTAIRGTRTLTAAATFDLRGGIIAIELSGGTGVRKSGAGAVRLDVPSSYTGNTEIVEGSLTANFSNAISRRSPIIVSAAGGLELGNFNASVLSIRNQGNVRLGEAELVIANDLVNEANGTFDNTTSTLVLGGDLQNQGRWPSATSNLTWNGTATAQRLRSGGATFNRMENRGAVGLVIEDEAVATGEFSQTAGSVQLLGGNLTVGSLTWNQGNLLGNTAVDPFRINVTTGATFQSGSINAPIRGGRTWTKNGTGSLSFSVPVSYDLEMVVNQGDVQVAGQGALPEQRNLKIAAVGKLDLRSGTASFANVDVAGNLNVGDATLVVAPTERVFQVEPGYGTVSGTVTGNKGFVKLGSRALTWSGINEIAGQYRVTQGELTLVSDRSLAKNSALTIDAAGVVRVSNAQVSNVELAGEGELVIASGGVLQLQKGQFAGTLRGTGRIGKQGQESWELTSSSRGDFSGNLSVLEGRLIANGVLPTAQVAVAKDAVLSGRGQLGSTSILSGGILSPGSSPGVIQLESLVLESGATLQMELDGRQPGATFDQVKVNGRAQLDGTIVVTFADALKQSFTSVDFFDLITFGSRAGTPTLRVTNGDNTFFVQTAILSNVYRLVIQIPSPPLIVDGPQDEATKNLSQRGVLGSPTLVMLSEEADIEPVKDVIGAGDHGVSADSDGSRWLDDADSVLGPAADAIATPEVIAAAIDTALAEGLTLDLSSIASDMKPLDREMLRGVEIPRSQSLGELREFPEWQKVEGEANNWRALSFVSGGLTASLLGLGAVYLGLSTNKRAKRSRTDDGEEIMLRDEDDTRQDDATVDADTEEAQA